MSGSHQIDIGGSFLLQFQENFCQAARCDFPAGLSQGDVPVLTIDTAQVAAAEKDGAGACAA